MKTVFTNGEIAHVWAYQRENGCTHGRTSNSNIFFEEETIYSYGYHFPMAKLTGKYDARGVEFVLVSTDRYSNTTTKHQSDVRCAVSHLHIIYVPTLNGSEVAMMRIWNYEFGQIKEGLAKARKPAIWMTKAQQLMQTIEAYFVTFKGEKVPQELMKAYKPLFDEKAMAKYAEEQKEREKKLAEQRKAKEAEMYKNFMEFKSSGFSSEYQVIRYNEKTERFETSRGVQIPRALAKVFYELLKNNSVYVGAQLLNYRVRKITDKTIEVGCHTFKLDYLKQYGAQYFG